jgi:hypothetical protein
MSSPVNVKSVYSMIAGPAATALILDLKKIFGNVHEPEVISQYNSSQSAERYYDHLYKLNELQVGPAKSKKQKNEDPLLADEDKKVYFDGQRFSHVFYDDQSRNLVNFIFTYVRHGLLDPFVSNLYINNSKLIIISACASNLPQLEDCIGLYKKYHSEFSYANLHNKALSQLLDSSQRDQFEKELKLSYLQDLKFSKNDNQKRGKALLVVFTTHGSANDPKYKKVTKALQEEKVNFVEIAPQGKRGGYLKMLMEIVLANFDVSNAESFKKALESKLVNF